MSLFLRFALVVFLFVPPASFLPLHAKDGDKEKPHWLAQAQVQALIDSIPACPAPGSATDRDDLAGVLKAQASRTPAQIEQVRAEAHFSPALFAVALGSDFSKKGEPAVYGLIEKAAAQVGVVSGTAKAKWQRPRPFRAYPALVHPAVDADGFSYPSGHSTAAHAVAVLLGEIFPDRKEALLERAGEIAEDRVIGGVHYPSDIAAGKQLGEATAQALLANPDFQKALAAAEATLPATAGK